MPFINAKVSTTISEGQEKELKTRLGKAIECIPGKSESWLMLGFEPEYKLYFKGDNSKPTAFVEVSVFGKENPQAFDALTGEICKIFGEVLGISADRIYVKYGACENWGWNGGNF